MKLQTDSWLFWVGHVLPLRQPTSSAAAVQCSWLLWPLAPQHHFAPQCTGAGFSEISKHTQTHRYSMLLIRGLWCLSCGCSSVCTWVRFFPAVAVSASVTSSFCICSTQSLILQGQNNAHKRSCYWDVREKAAIRTFHSAIKLSSQVIVHLRDHSVTQGQNKRGQRESLWQVKQNVNQSNLNHQEQTRRHLIKHVSLVVNQNAFTLRIRTWSQPITQASAIVRQRGAIADGYVGGQVRGGMWPGLTGLSVYQRSLQTHTHQIKPSVNALTLSRGPRLLKTVALIW